MIEILYCLVSLISFFVDLEVLLKISVVSSVSIGLFIASKIHRGLILLATVCIMSIKMHQAEILKLSKYVIFVRQHLML